MGYNVKLITANLRLIIIVIQIYVFSLMDAVKQYVCIMLFLRSSLAAPVLQNLRKLLLKLVTGLKNPQNIFGTVKKKYAKVNMIWHAKRL